VTYRKFSFGLRVLQTAILANISHIVYRITENGHVVITRGVSP